MCIKILADIKEQKDFLNEDVAQKKIMLDYLPSRQKI